MPEALVWSAEFLIHLERLADRMWVCSLAGRMLVKRYLVYGNGECYYRLHLSLSVLGIVSCDHRAGWLAFEAVLKSLSRGIDALNTTCVRVPSCPFL